MPKIRIMSAVIACVVSLAPAIAGAQSYDASRFAAISYNTNQGTWGYSYDFTSSDAARDRAIQGCNARSSTPCNQTWWVQGGCIALAAQGSAWGFGYSGSQDAVPNHAATAVSRALEQCASSGGTCSILQVVCVDGTTPLTPN